MITMGTFRYLEVPEEDLDKLIEDLEISSLHKRFLRLRWLRQLVCAREVARKCHARFILLRRVQIVGGVLVPVLVSVNVSGDIFTILHLITIATSLLVAITIALEQFSRYGEHWLHYRNVAEGLKVEGWQFLQLNGSYDSYKNYDDAYPVFATKVEEFLRDQEQSIIINIQKERIKGGKAAESDNGLLQKTSSQINQINPT